MLSEETSEVSPTVGNARGGQRSPGYSAVAARERRGDMAGPYAWPNSSSVWTMSRPGHDSRCWDEETGKPPVQGVYACQRLSLGVVGQARDLTNECRAEVRTGLGKSDCPGSQRGFGKRGQLEDDAPRGARVRLLSRQPHARIDGGREETGTSRLSRAEPGASRLPDQAPESSSQSRDRAWSERSTVPGPFSWWTSAQTSAGTVMADPVDNVPVGIGAPQDRRSYQVRPAPEDTDRGRHF